MSHRLARYHAYLAVAATILLITGLVAAADGGADRRDGADLSATASEGPPQAGAPPSIEGGAPAPTAGGTDPVRSGGLPSSAGGGASRPASRGAAPARAGGPAAAPGAGGTAPGPPVRIAGSGVGTPAALAAPDCDAKRKRLKVASAYAPPCVVPWTAGAENGGSTSAGVTATKIKVVALNSNGTTQAQQDSERRSFADYVTMFQDLYRMWGRTLEVEWYLPSGSDETSQRADAVKIAARKPFMVVSASTSVNLDVLVEELAARKIIVCCYTGITLARNAAFAPYLWGGTLGAPEAYELNFAQYVGRRLLGQTAKWAGQPEYQIAPRKFGLVYPDTWSNLSIFTDEFAKYGGRLTTAIDYGYAASEYVVFQERARTIVSRMKSDGVTTVLMAGGLVFDPIMSRTATSQNWFPEWVLAGTGGQDLDYVGRLNDPVQWQHAFGLATLPVGGDAGNPQDALHPWYWGRDRGTRSVAFIGTTIMFAGIHGAGPNLTPATFRDALFAIPPTGGAASGGVLGSQMSFGRHGFYPWDDYNAYDDFAEVWWDPSAEGYDVLSCSAGACARGVGKYRFLDGGRRYAPFQWPSGEPPFFETEGTALWYEGGFPPGDAPPPYPCDGCPSSRG